MAICSSFRLIARSLIRLSQVEALPLDQCLITWEGKTISGPASIQHLPTNEDRTPAICSKQLA